MEFDVVIVGAGPAGLAAAIRLKQLAAEKDQDLNVVVLEKGAEVGAHILSGAVVDPIALDKLLPDWREQDSPLKTQVSDDRFYYLTESGSVRMPNLFTPPLMNNHGCYAGSLGATCRWLGEQAEALGVEVYPGIAVTDAIFGENGEVQGVITGDMGVARDGSHKDTYTPGIALTGKYTLLAEGARGSLSKQMIKRFALDKDSGTQKFGIGLKELWEIPAEKHKPGLVQHTMGWPLNDRTGGGTFLYHFGDNLVSVGFVMHLDYANPYLNPFKEFQRSKTHPVIKQHLEGGKRISYGARALTEGGLQAIPKLTFPGGALLGCAAGFMNVPRIKGSHNAMLSGMAAAEAVFDAIGADRSHDELTAYEEKVRSGEIAKDLNPVRNVKPLWSRFGTRIGVALGGIDMWLNTLLPFLKHTLRHLKPDFASLEKADKAQPIEYPKPDNKLTFDILSSVFLSGTNHAEDQPVHLRLTDPSIPIEKNLPEYAEPAQRYCPAQVYEVIEEGGEKRFQINAQNCVHCKTCDIKDPAQNITWVPPEGGDGPSYANM
ncbi:electron transfer flavoprotein-ubiquinone oxidoreductase [Methyloligella sp. 2.7D]|uniref:electron transfer flavoprotein-ubiquinone oxidoreductase n=1 Tax=unclassified Methyloligella TaxID=2625955 RepID=UPI00157C33BD|nr:electron transfer flavoprotein-ubiquinone oxidoreductase [Methyloligella sp. GL2]QKP78867.1 electron transfer flavoprotein-ubiquinone oxidoreductase [Methyloligella sp. GL2]